MYRRKPSWWWNLKSKARSASTESRISDRPTMITINRHETLLPEQEVRIEAVRQNFLNNRERDNMFISERPIVVFGYYDHPKHPNFDVQLDDRFTYNNMNYRIENVAIHAGEVQALASRI